MISSLRSDADDLRSSAMLRSVEWQFRTGVLGQPVGPIVKVQAVQVVISESFIFAFITECRTT
jgi:hypothetical protein